jgi:hypothetical protein
MKRGGSLAGIFATALVPGTLLVGQNQLYKGKNVYSRHSRKYRGSRKSRKYLRRR